MNSGTSFDCGCCGRILIDGQYDLARWTADLKAYYESKGFTCDYYADVRGGGFDLDDYGLVILSLPDNSVTDSFVAEQLPSIASWAPTSGPKRIAVGTDWRGEGTYEFAVSDTTNAITNGITVLDDGGSLPVTSGNYTPEVMDLTAGLDIIAILGSDELTGGTNVCSDDGGTSFLRRNTVDGIDWVVAGSPAIFVEVELDVVFYDNLWSV